MKALVVDDSRVMRMLLSQMLKELGFEEVSQAKDGKEALAHLASHPDTQLALVDWYMPEMNGIELVEAVRADGSLNDVRLVMVTTESETEQIARALTLGANEYVIKPFTRDAMAGKLRTMGMSV